MITSYDLELQKAADFAMKHFKLSLPMTAEELKDAFRARARELHPDAGGDENTAHAFSDMKKAYDQLREMESVPGVFRGNGSFRFEIIETTTDGTPLSELGKGLGRVKNGKPCNYCRGQGYTEGAMHDWIFCGHCRGQGKVPKVYPCRACEGSGKFTQKQSRKVVDCFRCEGTGRFAHPWHFEVCGECRGLGTVPTRGRRIYHKCSRCKGAGQTEVFNPVVIKDTIGFASARR